MAVVEAWACWVAVQRVSEYVTAARQAEYPACPRFALSGWYGGVSGAGLDESAGTYVLGNGPGRCLAIELAAIPLTIPEKGRDWKGWKLKGASAQIKGQKTAR